MFVLLTKQYGANEPEKNWSIFKVLLKSFVASQLLPKTPPENPERTSQIVIELPVFLEPACVSSPNWYTGNDTKPVRKEWHL